MVGRKHKLVFNFENENSLTKKNGKLCYGSRKYNFICPEKIVKLKGRLTLPNQLNVATAAFTSVIQTR